MAVPPFPFGHLLATVSSTSKIVCPHGFGPEEYFTAIPIRDDHVRRIGTANSACRRENGSRSRSTVETARIALRISFAFGASSTLMIGRSVICSTER